MRSGFFWFIQFPKWTPFVCDESRSMFCPCCLSWQFNTCHVTIMLALHILLCISTNPRPLIDLQAIAMVRNSNVRARGLGWTTFSIEKLICVYSCMHVGRVIYISVDIYTFLQRRIYYTCSLLNYFKLYELKFKM